MTTDKTVHTALTPEEYRRVMVDRIDRALREADVPDAQRRDILSYVTSDGHKVSESRPSVSRVVSHPASHADQRTKIHWAAKGVKVPAEPMTISDVVLSGIVSGCQTVPELVKLVTKAKVTDNKDIRKAVYTALWALKKDGVIDQGDPPQD